MMLTDLSISLHSFGVRLMLFFTPIVLLCACSSGKKEEMALERFQVISPFIKDTVLIKEYVADIQSIQNVEIRAKASGYLESIHADEGQYVKAGQLLFSISGKQYAQELLKASASLTSAMADAKADEVELNNVKTLVQKNIVSQSELDLAQAKYEALQAKIEEARALESSATLQLSFAQIRAPFNGFINRIPNKTGSLIEEGTLLTTISNDKDVFAYFNVSEKDYLDYATTKPERKSKEVSLVLANDSLYNHKGLIETTESEFDKSTGNIAFRSRFPNPDQILKHGSSGKVLVKTELKNVVLIPQKSTFEIQENTYVFIVSSDSTVQMRKIISSVRLPHLYVVSSGLTTQDKIIYEGIQKVREGDKIIPENVSPSQLSNH